MQHILLKEYANHQCQLNKASDSCLPNVAPQTGKYRRLLHDYKKYLTVSKWNPKTKQCFGSSGAIIMERRRQIYTIPGYIIHPYSKLNVIIECVMYCLWMYGYLIDPIFVSFYEIETVYTPLVVATFIINLLISFHIGICFITGYQEVKTKEIILAPKKIVKHYLRSYFIFDLIGSIPFRIVVSMCRIDLDDIFHSLISALHLLRLARIATAFQCFRQVTLLLHMNDPSHLVASMIILTLLVLHWFSCIVYLCNKLLYYITGSISGYSWLRRLGVSAAQDDVKWFRRYIICLHTVTMNFYCSGVGMAYSYVFSEHIILSIIMIFGSVYFVYALVITLQLIRSSTTSESNYEEFFYQLLDYMRAKNLPQKLKTRILMYYEHRFQKKFFREQAILASLSEHLRHEIFLHRCRHLMESVGMFKVLPKHVVGLILASLKQEVFLPNDVILSPQTKYGGMYFISYGSVALYNSTGQEFLHLTDGMHFGISFLTETKNYDYIIVATEMTECYRWDRADYLRCATAYKVVAEVIEKLKIKTAKNIQNAEEEIKLAHGTDVLTDLRHQKIIERGQVRHEEED